MKSSVLLNLIDQFREQGRMVFGEPATEDQIRRFEKEAGVELPSIFKEWLRICDGGEFFLPAGLQVYGVAHKPLIDVDDNDRPNDNYVVIGCLASGDPILYEKNTERISIYNHKEGRIEADETYNDFISFLNDLYDLLGIGE